MDPNDYLSVEMRIGSRCVNVLNKNNKILLGARGTSDKDALRRVRTCVDALLEERKNNKFPFPLHPYQEKAVEEGKKVSYRQMVGRLETRQELEAQGFRFGTEEDLQGI